MHKSKNEHWDNFYNNKFSSQLNFPSQFASFTIGEKKLEKNLYEIGCGTGRDSYFFSKYFNNVFAFDKSKIVIKNNIKKYKNVNNLKFFEYDINDQFNFPKIDKKNKILYARFFLHSLKNEEIKNFVYLSNKILKKKERIFLEYRSVKDKKKNKIFRSHYRNFLNPTTIKKLFSLNSFRLIYSIQGRGYAKYKNEDAHVVRQIFEKK